MDEFEKLQLGKRAVEALEKIAAELNELNQQGLTIWGGTTIEEN